MPRALRFLQRLDGPRASYGEEQQDDRNADGDQQGHVRGGFPGVGIGGEGGVLADADRRPDVADLGHGLLAD